MMLAYVQDLWKGNNKSSDLLKIGIGVILLVS